MLEIRRIFRHRLWLSALLLLMAAQLFLAWRQEAEALPGALDAAIRARQEVEAQLADLTVEQGLRFLEEQAVELTAQSLGDESVRPYLLAVTQWQERYAHVYGYGERLAQIQAQAQRMNQTGLFAEEGSFDRQNIAKTAQDFSRLEGVALEPVNDHALMAAINSDSAPLFCLGLMLVTILLFFDDRQRSMRTFVYSTPRGRLSLAMWRWCALGLTAIVAQMAFYLLPMGLGMAVFQEAPNLALPLQSLPAFALCPIRVTIGEFLLLWSGLRMVSLLCFGALAWLVLSLTRRRSLGLLLLAALAAGEWWLYQNLRPIDYMGWLGSVNLIAYVDITKAFVNYENFPFFGGILSQKLLTFGSMVLVLLVSATGCTALQLRYPTNGKRPLSFPLPRMRLGGIGEELKKLLITERGLWVLGVFVLVLVKVWALPYPSLSETEAYAQQYAQRYAGPMDQQRLEMLQEARLLAEQELQDLAAKTGLPGVLESAKAKVDGISLTLERAQDLLDSGEPGLWLLPTTAYGLLYGASGLGYRMEWMLTACLALVLLLGSLFSLEQEQGTANHLQTLPGGGWTLLRRKLTAAILLSVIVFALATWREAALIQKRWGELPGLEAPAGSLQWCMPGVGTGSLRGCIAAVYGIRLLGLVSVGLLTAMVSAWSPGTLVSMLISAAVLALPAAIEALHPISPVWLLANTGLETGWELAAGFAGTGILWVLGAGYGWRRYRS